MDGENGFADASNVWRILRRCSTDVAESIIIVSTSPKFNYVSTAHSIDVIAPSWVDGRDSSEIGKIGLLLPRYIIDLVSKKNLILSSD